MSRAPSPAERACFGDAVRVESPRNVAELAEVIRSAEAAGRSVFPAGAGAHAEAADPRAGAVTLVSAESLTGAVTYEPDDFTVGVGAGTPLDELRALLAQNRQEVAHEWPLRAAGTIGGLVARAPWSPRQGSVGPLHSLLLGAEGVRGGGITFKSGGMVVKNVAGYQVHKLAPGSMGTLGVLTRVNFRLRPIPERRAAGVVACESLEAAGEVARALREAKLEPACLAVVAGNDTAPPRDVPWPKGAARVVYLFEGQARRVEWLSAEASRAVAAYLAGVEATRDDRAAGSLLDFLVSLEEPAERRELGCARISVLPSEVTRAHADLERRIAARPSVTFRTVADVLTGQLVARWTAPSPALLEAPVADVRETAARFEGVARLVHLPAPLRARFPRDLTPDPNALLAEKIRAVFDPRAVFGGAAAPARSAR